MDRGAWRAAVHGVAKSRTRLKQLGTQHHDLQRAVHDPSSHTDSKLVLYTKKSFIKSVYKIKLEAYARGLLPSCAHRARCPCAVPQMNCIAFCTQSLLVSSIVT